MAVLGTLCDVVCGCVTWNIGNSGGILEEME